MSLSTLEKKGNDTIVVTLPCKKKGVTLAKIKGEWGYNKPKQQVFIGKIDGDVEHSDIYRDGDSVQFTITFPEQNAGVLVYT